MGTQGKGRKRKSSPLWWSEKRQKQRKKKIPKFLGVLWIYSNFLITSLGNSPRRVTRCPWEAPAEGQPAEEMKELPNSSRVSLPSTFLSSLLTEVLLVAWQPPPRPRHASVRMCSSASYEKSWEDTEYKVDRTEQRIPSPPRSLLPQHGSPITP